MLWLSSAGWWSSLKGLSPLFPLLPSIYFLIPIGTLGDWSSTCSIIVNICPTMDLAFWCAGKGRREWREGERGGEDEDLFNMYLHISLSIFIYPLIISSSAEYLHILIYLKILNIKNMTANMKPKNGHNSGPRASPRIRI